MKIWLKIILIVILVILALSATAYWLRVPLMTTMARLLIIDDPLQPAEIIYILNGEVNTRPFHAAQLFERDLASQIVIPREEDGPASEIGLYPNGTDVSVNILQEEGVPEENIIVVEVEGGVTSTYDEAIILRDYIEANNIESVIVVTSSFHTRRSQWIFQKVLTDGNIQFQMSAAPQWKFDETDWWQEEMGMVMLANEYLKFAYYLAKY